MRVNLCVTLEPPHLPLHLTPGSRYRCFSAQEREELTDALRRTYRIWGLASSLRPLADNHTQMTWGISEVTGGEERGPDPW